MRSVRQPSRTLCLLALGLAAAVAAGSPAAAGTGPAAGGSAERGTLLSDGPIEGTAGLPSAGVNRLVAYVSQGAGGGPVAVSGTVSLPAGPPPPGGWPVVSWAHGTTGTADVCAPSADSADGPAHEYLSLMDQTLDRWVSQGFAVVQTDYEGLGMPGGHPYLNGPSAAASVSDIVRAARELDPRVGRDWVAVGHSQGGHAALSAAAQQGQQRELNLLGAVSIAPGGIDVSQVAAYIRGGGPGVEEALPFLSPLLLGAEAADPGISPEELLTEEAQPLLDAGRTGCMGDVEEAAAEVPADDVIEPGAELEPLETYLRAQEPSGLTVQVPTLVAQGAEDTLVPRPDTDRLVGDLCERSDQVGYRVYAGDGHREAVASSYADAVEFTTALRKGQDPPPHWSGC
ncbi:serine aminopeptidase domain-containing protein [Nocardiopsis coralliicola]